MDTSQFGEVEFKGTDIYDPISETLYMFRSIFTKEDAMKYAGMDLEDVLYFGESYGERDNIVVTHLQTRIRGKKK
jgi:hypothetical protein